MAKKTNPKPKSEFVDANGFVCLSGTLLWKYRAIDAEFRNSQLALQKKQEEIDKEIKKNDALRMMVSEKTELVRATNVKAQELQQVQKEIEEKTNLSLKGCGIDEVTGQIFQLQDDGGKTLIGSVTTKAKRTKKVPRLKKS